MKPLLAWTNQWENGHIGNRWEKGHQWEKGHLETEKSPVQQREERMKDRENMAWEKEIRESERYDINSFRSYWTMIKAMKLINVFTLIYFTLINIFTIFTIFTIN